MKTQLIRLFAVAALLIAGIGAAGAADRYMELYIPNAMALADVGDWVLIKLPGGAKQKHSIIERKGEGDDAKVTLRIENIVNGKVVSAKNETVTAGEQFVKPPVPKGKEYMFERREEGVMFEDTEIAATIIEVYEDDKKIRTWYLSPEFPIYGTMKKVRADGTVEFEVEDYDFGASSSTEPTEETVEE